MKLEELVTHRMDIEITETIGNRYKITSVLDRENVSMETRMTHGSESRKEVARPNPLLTPTKTTFLVIWNDRAMFAAGKAAQIAG